MHSQNFRLPLTCVQCIIQYLRTIIIRNTPFNFYSIFRDFPAFTCDILAGRLGDVCIYSLNGLHGPHPMDERDLTLNLSGTQKHVNFQSLHFCSMTKRSQRFPMQHCFLFSSHIVTHNNLLMLYREDYQPIVQQWS